MIIHNREAALAEAKKLYDRRRRRKRLKKELSVNPVAASAQVVETPPADGQTPQVDWPLLQVRGPLFYVSPSSPARGSGVKWVCSTM